MKCLVYTIALASCFSFVQCKKDKPSKNLPPVTQEGKNTVGFKVNGEIWTPFYKCSYSGDPCGEISARYGPPYNSTDWFSFQVARSTSDHLSALTISSLTPITTIGDKFDSITINYLTGNGSNLGTSYNKTYQSSRTFDITRIDIVNQIISGVFSFKLFNTSGGTDSIEITDGRFDFRMNACICR